MILRKTNTLKKTFSFNDFPQTNVFLGVIPENSLGFRIDIDSSLNKGKIDIRDENNLILENLSVINKFVSFYDTLLGNLFIDLKETPTTGIISIYVYYIFSDSFAKLNFDFNDFYKQYEILDKSHSRKIFNLFLKIEEEFDDGILYFGNDTKKDKIAKVNLKTLYKYFLFEGDNSEEIKVFFEGNPTKGKGNISILYFDL